MDYSSFDNLNLLYHFTPVDRYPMIQISQKRLSFPTELLTSNQANFPLHPSKSVNYFESLPKQIVPNDSTSLRPVEKLENNMKQQKLDTFETFVPPHTIRSNDPLLIHSLPGIYRSNTINRCDEVMSELKQNSRHCQDTSDPKYQNYYCLLYDPILCRTDFYCSTVRNGKGSGENNGLDEDSNNFEVDEGSPETKVARCNSLSNGPRELSKSLLQLLKLN